jgi:hypothetical protein
VSSRFVSNLTVAILGALLVTGSLALRSDAVSWLAFGVGCATVSVTLIAFAVRGRGRRQRTLDVSLVLLGGWTIISARTVSGVTLRWLAFSEAVAMLGLAVVGMIGHELIVQRELRSTQEIAEPDDVQPAEFERPLSEPRRVTAW